MTTPSEPGIFAAPFGGRLHLIALVVALSATLLTGCGKDKDKAATQTAAKVNKEEITVHQINFLLSQRGAVPPEQAASASRQTLERLIDQELEIQQAADQKLDRQPRVVQQIEAARREIVARAYIEKISEGAPKPTPQEVAAYYEAHPELFKERRAYNLQEVNIEATPEQVTSLKGALPAAKTFGDFLAYLKTNNFHYSAAEAVRTAEQLPLASLKTFAAIRDGQAVFTVRPSGAQIIYLMQSKLVPVTEQQATLAIEKFLYNQRKLKLLADDLQTLRSAAKIEYMGSFAADAAKEPYRPASAPELPPLTSIAPPAPESSAVAAPQVEVAPADVSAASMPSDATLDKGLKGMK
ncbi:MAG: EpsD family peptidyl-prolyl cis-trans isomerase [Pseudomonadota bacterium]|nr:EpsD family peptidyl-prolyl cis-trans isomerase [Pseudomonadota bacterium]